MLSLGAVGYAVGLATADAAVMWSGMGQPALLYLVPCTLGVVRCAAVYLFSSSSYSVIHLHTPYNTSN